MVSVNMLLRYSITGEPPQRHYRGLLEVMYGICGEYREAHKDDRPPDG